MHEDERTPDRTLIDPRGPRFVAGITSLLLGTALVLALTSPLVTTAQTSFGQVVGRPANVTVLGWTIQDAPVVDRIADPAFLLLAAIALLFLWGVVAPRTAPWSVLFRTAVQPRLAPPRELEDPRPPRFAQGVGLFVVGVGLILHVAGVPLALAVAAALAFVAAFLNAVFGLCLGCQLYLVLQRMGVVGRARTA